MSEHGSMYRIRKGFRDTDGKYYKRGTELKLLKDSHVKSLVKEGKLEPVQHPPENSCMGGYHWVKGHTSYRNGQRINIDGHYAKNPEKEY